MKYVSDIFLTVLRFRMSENQATKNRAENETYLKEAKEKLQAVYDMAYYKSVWGGPQAQVFNINVFVGGKYVDIAEYYLRLGGKFIISNQYSAYVANTYNLH